MATSLYPELSQLREKSYQDLAVSQGWQAPLEASTPGLQQAQSQAAVDQEISEVSHRIEQLQLQLNQSVANLTDQRENAAQTFATVEPGRKLASNSSYRKIQFAEDSDTGENHPTSNRDYAPTDVALTAPAAPRIAARRTRSLSASRQTPPDTVAVPTDLLLKSLAAANTRMVPDVVVAPKPFTGNASQDPESWLEYFERYCDFRKLSLDGRRELFRILLQEGAADWLTTLPNGTIATYDELVAAFKNNYYRSPELKWKEAGDLWNQVQGPNERVEDFVTRLRKAARRLNFPPEVLHYAVISGLRGPLKLHVVQQGVRNLDDTIRAAKVAEAAATTTPDVLSMLMLDAMKATAQASEKQAAEIKQLTTRVAALATTQAATDTSSRTTATATFGASKRPLLPTPQNQQRQMYAQRSSIRTDDGPRSFRRDEQQAPECGRCGTRHRQGSCRADGQQCRHCGKQGHFARVCRSARPTRD